MGDLSGRVALVSGGARGIGAATARALATAGAQVLITDLIDGSDVAAEIGGAYLKHDVTVEDEWAEAISFARKRFGGLDILVNNAGVFWVAPLVETDLGKFRKMQQVNVDGVFLGMKHAAPAIAERAAKWDGGGAIVNLSSVAGLIGGHNFAAYNASKGGVRLLTKSVALHGARIHPQVRCNSVHPAFLEGPMVDLMLKETSFPDAARARITRDIPLGRLGTATEVADMCVYLLSDESRFVTGAEFVIDGGLTAR